MALKDNWVDKIDGFDEVKAEDINGIAHSVIKLEEDQNKMVQVADIVDNLTSDIADKPLSAAQGVLLKKLIDELANVLELPIRKLTLAANSTWYKSTTDKSSITKITLVDSYAATGSENETWNAGATEDGYVTCYRSGTELTLAGKGCGAIYANADSSNVFADFTALEEIVGLSLLNTSKATTTFKMFNNCTSLTTLDVSEFDMSNVTDTRAMFQQNNSVTYLDVSRWNVGSVTTMQNMFYSCFALTELNVSNWDVGNVENMRQIFGLCRSLAVLDVSKWDTGKATTMAYLFVQMSAVTVLDVSNWDTSNVTDMTSLFYNCSSVKTLDVSKWNTENVTAMAAMFMHCTGLESIDVSKWDTSKVTTTASMFSGNSHAADMKMPVIDVSNWDTSSLVNADRMFYGCGRISSVDLRKWNTSKITNLSHLFADCMSLTSIQLPTMKAPACQNFDAIFNDCRALVSIDVSGLVTASAIAISQMFEYCRSLTTVIGLDTFDTSNVKTFHAMFRDCEKLTELDLHTFNTSTAENGVYNDDPEYGAMDFMFENMHRLQRVTLGPNFEFIEPNCYLPTPNSAYIPNATGKWRDSASVATALTPMDVAEYHNNNNKKTTYVAITE